MIPSAPLRIVAESGLQAEEGRNFVAGPPVGAEEDEPEGAGDAQRGENERVGARWERGFHIERELVDCAAQLEDVVVQLVEGDDRRLRQAGRLGSGEIWKNLIFFIDFFLVKLE